MNSRTTIQEGDRVIMWCKPRDSRDWGEVIRLRVKDGKPSALVLWNPDSWQVSAGWYATSVLRLRSGKQERMAI